MTVDESIENLKTVVEAFERLRVGLVPFVEDTVTQKFPNLGLEDLKALSQPSRQLLPREISLREMPDTYASMDIAAILNLMETHSIRDRDQNKPDVLDAFRNAFGGKVANLMGSLRTLKNYRNRAAHHNGLAAKQLTLNQVREVLATAATWLEAISDRYPTAKEQLAKLEAMQAELGRPLADPHTMLLGIPETMEDYVPRNPDLRAALGETIRRRVGVGNPDVTLTSQQDDLDGEVAKPLTVKEVLGEGPMPVDSDSEIHIEAEIEALNQAISSDPGNADLYFHRGLFYYDLERYEQAIADFGQVLVLSPQDADTYFCRGLPYFDLKQYEPAIADFDQAIALNPQHIDAYFHRGLSCFFLEQYEQAIADFDQALTLNPQHIEAYFHRGSSCFFLERYEQAIADFDQALTLNPQETDDSTLAWVSSKGEVFDFNPQDAAAYSMRGLSYVNLEQYEPAIEDYTRVIELDPKDAATYFCRGLCYTVLQRFDQALADFSQAITLNPQESEAYITRGRCYTELHQYRQAVADFTTAIGINPTAQLHQARGEAYESWGNEAPLDDQSQLFDQALADYEEADRLRDFE